VLPVLERAMKAVLVEKRQAPVTSCATSMRMRAATDIRHALHSRRKTADQYNVAFNRSGAALS
jgi:hypothetical protein